MNMRSFWWLALAFTLLWIWLQWTQFQHKQTQQQAPAIEQQSDNGVPVANPVTSPNDQAPKVNAKGSDVPSTKANLISGQRVQVKTDVFHITLDTEGGDIRDVELLKYAAQHDHSKPFKLMSDKGQLFYIAQNGIAVQPNAKLPAPTHKSLYQTAQSQYVMTDKTLTVPMVWQKDGIKVIKTYTFTKGSYLIKISYKVENQSGQEWSGSLYSQIKRSSNDPYHNRMMYTYTGPVLYDGNAENKYNKHSFEDLEKHPVIGQTATGGWGAMIQHYFMSAVIPNQKAQNSFYAKALGHNDYSVGVVEPMVKVAPGHTGELTSELYVGPIIQDKLDAIAPGLALTVDYGILTIIAKPIFWVLEKIHAVVGNWGWSIIFLTILIKALFFKLSETSYRSMARLKKFQPKLKQLKENYGDDKALFQQKMMALYKEEKINPLGGCLPILVQMPVFIALYWVLLYSAEMRQAPWMLWIQDLSAKDPYYILPVLMGISMWVQQKLNPSAMMDEMQQKVMKLLPFIFTVFFMFFPAGLVLYWVVNNILSVTQQWYITKKIEAGEEK